MISKIASHILFSTMNLVEIIFITCVGEKHRMLMRFIFVVVQV